MRLSSSRWIVVAIAASAIATFTGSAAAECADDPHVAGQCFTVHGRLRLYANLRLYLWPVGTKRLLGVEYPPGLADAPSDPFMPENLRALIKPDVDLFGDFTLCPFTPDEP